MYLQNDHYKCLQHTKQSYTTGITTQTCIELTVHACGV
jgi:hypothetical protein